MKITDQSKNSSFSDNNYSYIHENLFRVWGRKLKPKGIAVYLCLACNANNDECQISINKIVEQLGISKKNVISSIKVISDLGLIEIQQSDTDENIYKINDMSQIESKS